MECKEKLFKIKFFTVKHCMMYKSRAGLIKAHLYAALVLNSLLFGIEFHATLTIDLATLSLLYVFFIRKIEVPKELHYHSFS